MPQIRPIRKVIKSKPTIEGAGVYVKRAFGSGDTRQFDPFLLFDDFRSDEPDQYLRGFPWHPHRGIETITYILRGQVEHADSLGNSGIIAAGEVQWMTAGSGIIHQEMPKGDSDGRMYGFQLWANLPKSHKMMAPRYQEIKREMIPEVTLEGGARVRVICGEVNGQSGPVQNMIIDPEYLDVTLPPGGAFSHPTQPGYTVFAYVIAGRGVFSLPKGPVSSGAESRESGAGDGDLVVFGDGEQIQVAAVDARKGSAGVRFLLIVGKPINEPVAWYGPIVMNTEEELRTAFRELREGTFIKTRG